MDSKDDNEHISNGDGAGVGVGGDYMFRMRGEAHMWSPDAVATLQHAVRKGSVWWLRQRERNGRMQTVIVTVQTPELV